MDQSIILLTYKGKVLLMHKDYILTTLNQSPWEFICGIRENDESSQETIQREVREETSIQLKTIAFLGSLVKQKGKKYFYHTQLTDENVNNMVRREGKILGFFSAKELEKLPLSLTTQLFLEKHGDLLGKTDEEV